MFAIAGQSMPVFRVGLWPILLFTAYLGWLPSAGGIDPLGWLLSASQMRIVHSSMLGRLDADSVKMARVQGLSQRLVIWKHALKNAATPVFTLFAVNFDHLISGAVVTETDSLQHIGFLTTDLAMQVTKDRLRPTAKLLEYRALDLGRHIKAS